MHLCRADAFVRTAERSEASNVGLVVSWFSRVKFLDVSRESGSSTTLDRWASIHKHQRKIR
jgi:hypothetical protein